MCKKLICLASLALVLGLVWTSPTRAAEPGLEGWWKFDGDGLDASGKGHAGTLAGNAQYVAGHSGQALALDGDGDYFAVTGWKGLMSTTAVTVTAWAKTTGNGTMVCWGRDSSGRRVDFRLESGRLRIEHGGGNLQGDTTVNDGEWHHVAVTIGAGVTVSYPDVKVYLDGRDDSRRTTDPDPPFRLADHASNVDVSIGYRATLSDRYFPGMIDDVRIYNRVLIATEIKELATRGYLANAHSPSPADGGKVEDTWTTLSWTAGPLATSHKLYFGTNLDEVSNRVETAFVGSLKTNSQPVGFVGFPAPEGLAPGTTYYWCVDEVSDTHPDSPWRGQVWSFRIPALTAYEPVPVDGDPAVPTDMKLSWSLALKGILHGVYFGTNQDQVTNATGAPPYVNTTYDPGPLTAATRYYWRVDTFNGAEWRKGSVWTFTVRPNIPVSTDPNLVAWWKLNERPGTHILDWSGHNNNGTFRGNPAWADGIDGAALKLDGSESYVNIDGYKGITGGHARSVTAWINTTSTAGVILGWGVNTSPQRMELRTDVGRLRTEHQGGNVQGSTYMTDGGWHHVAVTIRENATISYPEVKIYLDGLDDSIPTSDPDAFATVADRDVRIGSRPSLDDRFFTGLIDDVRLYDKELTAQEIERIMRTDPLAAWRPAPKDGATPDIEHVTPLTWVKGDKAAQHEVYFGTDKTAVADANTSDATGLYRGRQSTTSYSPAEGLAWGGGPYYWRVDENNNDGTVTKGKIWGFKVADYLIVDDIESYNDLAETDPASRRIYKSWIDGFGTTTNGAFVGEPNVPLTQRANVHGGGQAMPLRYDNNLKFSEATLTLTSGKDWTRQGVTELSLWFRGLSANAAEKLYVALNGTAVVYHADPNVAKITQWTEWVIPLQQFANLGVNLTNVTSITIGLGTRGSTTIAGGTGQMFFDDIRLRRTPVVPAAPVLAIAPAVADDPTRISAVPAP